MLQPLNFDNLQKRIDDKIVSVQKHPKLDLYIYNYTQRAQFDKIWDNETLQCRGLILDGDRNIVARPFPKFFNLGEILGRGEQIPAEDFVVTEKMDGSLGILYRDADGRYSLATRGSFVSDQARKGTAMLRTPGREQFLETAFDYILKGKTVLVEIIYPENRIVVDYGKEEKLTLLAIIDNETREELPYQELWEVSIGLDLPVVEKYDGLTDFENLESRPNSEGYVIHFPSSGQRFKVKFDEYVRLHKLITGVNKKTIWELLMNKHSVEELLDRVPDEFFQWVTDTVKELQEQFFNIKEAAIKDFMRITTSLKDEFIQDGTEESQRANKKAFALRAVKSDYRSILFRIFDNDPYDEVIWKMIKPEAEKPYKVDIDA